MIFNVFFMFFQPWKDTSEEPHAEFRRRRILFRQETIPAKSQTIPWAMTPMAEGMLILMNQEESKDESR